MRCPGGLLRKNTCAAGEIADARWFSRDAQHAVLKCVNFCHSMAVWLPLCVFFWAFAKAREVLCETAPCQGRMVGASFP